MLTHHTCFFWPCTALLKFKWTANISKLGNFIFKNHSFRTFLPLPQIKSIQANNRLEFNRSRLSRFQSSKPAECSFNISGWFQWCSKRLRDTRDKLGKKRPRQSDPLQEDLIWITQRASASGKIRWIHFLYSSHYYAKCLALYITQTQEAQAGGEKEVHWVGTPGPRNDTVVSFHFLFPS